MLILLCVSVPFKIILNMRELFLLLKTNSYIINVISAHWWEYFKIHTKKKSSGFNILILLSYQKTETSVDNLP